MRKTKKGFTLVELLVVIAIIAIIAAVAVPVTIGQINKSKEKTANTECNNAIQALQQIQLDIAELDTKEKIQNAFAEAFPKPTYVKEITITEGENTCTIAITALQTGCGVELGKIEADNKSFTMPRNYGIKSTLLTSKALKLQYSDGWTAV